MKRVNVGKSIADFSPYTNQTKKLAQRSSEISRDSPQFMSTANKLKWKCICSRTVENMKRNGNDWQAIRSSGVRHSEGAKAFIPVRPTLNLLIENRKVLERKGAAILLHSGNVQLCLRGGGTERPFHCRTLSTLLLKSYKNSTKEGMEFSEEEAKKQGLERAFIPLTL